MNINLLSQASSFNPGSQLWVVPDFRHSAWTLKIDWYLNFQISKLEKHKWENRSEVIEYLNEKTDLNIQNTTPIESESQKSSLFNGEHIIPAKWLIVTPFNEDLSQWTQTCFKHWNNLNNPSVRFFLPKAISPSDFSVEWKKLNDSADITLVSDITT